MIGAVLIGCSSPGLLLARQDQPRPQSSSEERRVADVASFLGGVALGLVAHEGGHLLFDVAFDADPGLKKVTFGPIPFFAITHRGDLSPRREFTVSSAGFGVQHALSEWILTGRPRLQSERAPLAKGILTFNVVTSTAYAGAAFAHAGPSERDTRGMAESRGLEERWIGAMVLAPALLDAYRYFHPEARWARWSSRGMKVGLVLLVLK